MKTIKFVVALCLLLASSMSLFAQPAATPEAEDARQKALLEAFQKMDPAQQELLVKISEQLNENPKFGTMYDYLQMIQERDADIAPTPAIEAAPAQEVLKPQKPAYQQKAEAMAPTQIIFTNEEYDFGTVKDGDIVKHVFTFKNVGTEPFVLQRARASCGCTVPTWTKAPVAPGEEGKLEVEFNSKNKAGMQTKTITVTGNFEGNINKVLRIRGEVLPANNH